MAANIAHDALAMVEYSDIPALLVLADSDAGFQRARQAAESAGCRISDEATIEGAAERLEQQIAVDGVLVDVERDHGAALDLLLERLDSGVRTGSFGGVVSAPHGLIDTVAAATPHSRIEHLCDASESELTFAVGIACARPPARLHDISKDRSTARLQQISEEVGRIAGMLASLSEEQASPVGGANAGEGGTEEISAATIRSIIRARRLRDQYFKSELFADPAWDMLLDLMAARLDGQRVAVSSLCIAAAVPPTTALRWIKTLTDCGLFVRVADPQDGRRVFIELSDGTVATLTAYLKAVQRTSPLII